jgi:tetratricopeptide (TPR) repeat protein
VYRFREEDTAEALRLFEQAIELDHEFGPAYAGKSSCHFNQVFLSHTKRPIDELEEAHRAARRAVALDEKDAFAHWAMARALFLRREHDQAIAELGTAIECNPSLAAAHYAMAWVLALASRCEMMAIRYGRCGP